MAYGIKVLNAVGEEVLDLNKVYYTKEEGTTKTLESAIIDSKNSIGYPVNSVQGSYYATRSHTLGFGNPLNLYGNASYFPDYSLMVLSQKMDAATRVCFTGVAAPIPLTPGPDRYFFGNKFNMAYSDLIFYDVSTYGLNQSITVFAKDFPFAQDLPNAGFAVCKTQSGMNIPYKIVSTEVPTYSGADTYGVKVNNSSGNNLFDSRKDTFTIYDHVYVDKYIIEEVMLTGSHFDITLREPVPNFLICPSNFSNFDTVSNTSTSSYIKTPQLKKINDSTLRIQQSEPQHRAVTNYPTGTKRTYFQDTVILIGK